MLGEQYRTPNTFKDPLNLFEVTINNVIFKKMIGPYTHAQWAYIIFGNGGEIEQGYLSIVTNNFGNYLIRENRSQKYSFDFIKIEEDFPKWFQTGLEFTIIDEIQLALKKEKEAALKQRIGKIIDINAVTFLAAHEHYFLYHLH